MHRIIIAAVVCALAAAAPRTACAKTLEVPSQYRTIQSAVNAALPGDIVHVHPGVYKEAVMIAQSYGVCIQGDHGAVMDGSTVLALAAINVSSTGNSVSGLTIQNYGEGIGLHAAAHINHNTVTGCGVGIHVLVVGNGSLPAPTEIDHNIVNGNRNGIFLDTCENVTVDHNTVCFNNAPDIGAGIVLSFAGTCTVTQNITNGNDVGIWAELFNSGCTFTQNTATGNGIGIWSELLNLGCTFAQNKAVSNQIVDIEDDDPEDDVWSQNTFVTSA